MLGTVMPVSADVGLNLDNKGLHCSPSQFCMYVHQNWKFYFYQRWGKGKQTEKCALDLSDLEHETFSIEDQHFALRPLGPIKVQTFYPQNYCLEPLKMKYTVTDRF